MSTWSVQISGDNFDLEDLPEWFKSPELKVVKESDGYYLHSNHFDSAKDANEVRILAEKLTENMVGAAKLLRPDFQPVKLGSVDRENDSGGKNIHIFVSDTINVRSKVRARLSVNGGVQKPSIPKPTTWLSIAYNEEKVEHALRIWGKEPHDWINLYKILEIIESDVGGNIYLEGWTNKSEIRRFTQTANSFEILGDEARHAKENVPAPAKPMTIQEAQQLFRELLQNWIESKRI